MEYRLHKKIRTTADRLDVNNMIYVADSAALTKDNLYAAFEHNISLISLLPSTFNIEKNLGTRLMKIQKSGLM